MTDSGLSKPDKHKVVGAYLFSNGFEVSIAVAVLVTAAQFLLDPSVRAQVAIGTVGPVASWLWTVLYLLGGAGMLCGLIRINDRVEIAGLSCFLAASLVNAFGLWDARGPRAIYIVLIFLSFAVGAAVRIRWLILARRVAVPTSLKG